MNNDLCKVISNADLESNPAFDEFDEAGNSNGAETMLFTLLKLRGLVEVPAAVDQTTEGNLSHQCKTQHKSRITMHP